MTYILNAYICAYHRKMFVVEIKYELTQMDKKCASIICRDRDEAENKRAIFHVFHFKVKAYHFKHFR